MNENLCYECGKDTSFGSGRFVDRDFSGLSYQDRVENEYPFPEGAYICRYCNSDFETMATVKEIQQDIKNLRDARVSRMCKR